MTRRPSQSCLAIAGFTIVELLLVMGMLGMFLIFLTQMLSSSLSLWQRGTERAALEARAAMVLQVLAADFENLRGVSGKSWSAGREGRFQAVQRAKGRAVTAGRLYSHWNPFDGATPVTGDRPIDQPKSLDWFPELRMTVTLTAAETDLLHRKRLKREIQAEEGQMRPSELASRVQERLPELPTRAPGEVALRVVPNGEENGCYLSVYRDVRLLDGKQPARWVDLAPLPPPTAPLLSNVMYVEYLFRSQATESFEMTPGGRGGPESCWDSARAGTFPEEHAVLYFGGDLDRASLLDPLDDVMPSWVQVRATVDEGPDLAYTALLGKDLEADSTEVFVDYADRLPPADEQPFLKIGGEWIRYSSLSGSRLIGVKRGQRNTKARKHRDGSRVHAGREVVVRMPISVSREYWNAK